MLNAALISLLFLVPSAEAASEAPAPRDVDKQTARGMVAWFDGTFDEAVAHAVGTNKLVMIEFWADWCGWCKQHESENLSDRKVVASFERFVCIGADLSVDEDGNFLRPEAEALMKRFAVRRFPTLVFVDGEGQAVDLVSGFLPAQSLLAEVDRIARGDKTVGYWKARIDSSLGGLESRYQYALKLDALGDFAGYQREIAFIEKADPDGVSIPMRRMALQVLTEELWGCMRDPDVLPDPAELEFFLDSEVEPELLCNGWLLMAAVRKELKNPVESRQAYREAWRNARGNMVAPVGNGIGWAFWIARDELSPADERFALRVSRKATKAFEEVNFDPAARTMYYDTLACCYFLNGQTSKAIEWMKRCMELAPDVQGYVDRLELFETNG